MLYNTENVKLTSAEIAGLWSSYIFESMMHHIFSYFVSNVDDKEICAFIEYCTLGSRSHINAYSTVFQKENLPVPRGTTSEDINVNAPRLFSDKFYITYIKNMASVAMTQLVLNYTGASRSDIRRLYREQLNRLEEIDQMGTELMINKGIYVSAPYVDLPVELDFVKRQSFLAGFLGNKRPLTVLEIRQLFMNVEANALGKVLYMGFSQIARIKEIRNYISKGQELSDKYFRLFSEVLLDEDIAVPPSLESETMAFSGTESPFSDRLMLTQAVFLNAYGIGNYGMAMAQSQRHDLMAMYAKVMAEVGTYASDGADLLIENGWLEQAPTAPERKSLAGV